MNDKDYGGSHRHFTRSLKKTGKNKKKRKGKNAATELGTVFVCMQCCLVTNDGHFQTHVHKLSLVTKGLMECRA